MSEIVAETSKDVYPTAENLRKKIRKSCLFLSIGVLLSCSAYVGLIALQSNLNISNNLGTTSLSVLYTSAFVMNLPIVPSALLCMGTKVTLIVSELCFSFFTLANFYPKFYTLVPASIITSFAESTIWFIGPMFITKTVAVLWPVDEKLKQKFLYLEDCRMYYIALYCCVQKSVQFFGNSISYAILYGGLLWSHNDKRNITNFSNCALLEHDMSFQQDRKKYQALSKAAVYVLIGVYLVMQLSACGIHGYFLDSNFTMQPPSDNREISTTVYLKKILCDTLGHIFTLEQILLSPINVLFGLIVSFTYADYARSFVACTLGVEKVGLALAIYGISNVTFAYILGLTGKKFGMHSALLTHTCMQTLTWLGLFLWHPNTGNVRLSYLIGIALGACDSALQLITLAMIPIYFPSTLEIAFSIQSLWVVVGVAIGFAATSLVIIRTKLYILIGFLVIGLLGYLCTEILRKQKNSRKGEKAAILKSNN